MAQSSIGGLRQESEAHGHAEAIVQTIRLPILILDETLHVISSNPAFCRFFTARAKDLERQSFEQTLAGLIDMPAIRARVFEVLANNDDFHDLEGEFEIPGAGKKTLLIEAQRLVRPGPHPAAVLLILQDITARKIMERRIQAIQRIEAVGKLASGVAHDFNNILTVVQGRATFLRDVVTHDETASDDVRMILDASKRAARLTSQLLAFSRRQQQALAIVDLNQVIEELNRMLHRLIGEDIELVAKLAPGLRLIKADVSQLEQVVLNLVVNARDAMPNGGKLVIETGNAELDLAYGIRKGAEVPPGEYVMLAVSDTGTGMTKEVRTRIWEPFFTTKEAGKGTGLGLSTVYGIVKQSDGFIWAYSEPGQGSVFKIYLHPAEATVPTIRERRRTADPSRGSETILLVEDDDMVRSTTARILEKAGYKVEQTRDGEEALTRLESAGLRITLVLTDLVMPRMNGRELGDRVREKRPDVSVVFMSGYTSNSLFHQGVLEQGALFLSKPFSTDDLLGTIRGALDRK